MGLSAADLKVFLAELKELHPGFSHDYKNMTAAHLACHEWRSAQWKVPTILSALPAALKKDKEKQLREAAIARGEVVPDEAPAEPPKKKMTVGAAMAAADLLSHGGAMAPAAPAAVVPAAVVQPAGQIAGAIT